MIARKLRKRLENTVSTHPVAVVAGPRQSGKTTLVKAVFPDYGYVSLEDPDTREFAQSDPLRFLDIHSRKVIFDEVQRAPKLLSHLQTIVDTDDAPGRFILAGLNNLRMMRYLAGSMGDRAALTTLLPLSLAELTDAEAVPATLEELLAIGGYPHIHRRGLNPKEWYGRYVSSFIEREVIKSVTFSHLERFKLFLRMCAARVGQPVNLSTLANDCGITHNTSRAWISILEDAYLVHLLRPYRRSFNKRLVKAPKLYFLDTGLLVYLLGIDRPADLVFHSARGSIFENWVLSELLKSRIHSGRESNLFFWRDYSGREVNFLADGSKEVIPIEVRSGKTENPEFFKGLQTWCDISGAERGDGWVVYGGDESWSRSRGRLVSWRRIGEHCRRIG